MQTNLNVVANVVLRRALRIATPDAHIPAKATKAELLAAVNARLNDRFSTRAARRRMLNALAIAGDLTARGALMTTYSYVFSFDGVPSGVYKDPHDAAGKLLATAHGPIKGNFAGVAQKPQRKVVALHAVLPTLLEGTHMHSVDANGYKISVGRVINRD